MPATGTCSPTHTNADDITIFSHQPDQHIAVTHLQDYTNTMEQWLLSNRLKVSISKPTLTLVILLANQSNLQLTITLNNTPIPYTNTATTLGVTYDRGVSFNTHRYNKH